MRVSRTYAGGGLLGGFFGNSQDKFSHMAGAEGGFDRQEFRDLRRRKRQGESLTGADSQRLNYMKNVRGDRTKKAIMGGALAAGAAIAGGPALAGALQNAGGLSGIAGKIGGLAGKLKGSGVIGNIQKGKQLFDALTPDQEAQIDTGNFGQPDQFLNYGGKIRVLKAEEGVKVPEGADVRSLLASLDRFSEEKKRRKKMEERQFAPSTPDKEMNREVLSFLLEKFKDSVPSIMGSKASDRYYNR